jgi:hypothetical protein
VLFPEKNFNFREKCHISGKFFGISGKIFSYSGKNGIYPKNFFGMSGKYVGDDLPPVVNISGKNFLDALFFRKVPLKAWSPQLLEASYAPARNASQT